MLAAPAAAEEAVTFTDVEVKRLLQHSPLLPPPPDETTRRRTIPSRAPRPRALLRYAPLRQRAALVRVAATSPSAAATDGLAKAHGSEEGRRHTPSLWNVAYNRWYFWDGRADSLWSQALQPIESPLEMAGSRDAAVRARAGRRVPAPRLRGRLRGLPRPARDASPACSSTWASRWRRSSARILSRRAPFDVFVEALRAGDLAGQSALEPRGAAGREAVRGARQLPRVPRGPGVHRRGVPRHRPEAGTGRPTRDVSRGSTGCGRASSARGAGGATTDGPRASYTRFLARAPHAQGQFKTPTPAQRGAHRALHARWPPGVARGGARATTRRCRASARRGRTRRPC